MNYLYLTLLAQTDLQQAVTKIASVINMVAVLLFFGATILAGIMVTMGRTEFLKHSLIGSAIGGLSWIFVNSIFDTIGSPSGPNL